MFMLTHSDIWRALDALAERHRLSPSALALKAGLSATAFNPSKRAAHGRLHWPSTESLARVLKVLDVAPADFVALAGGQEQARSLLPLMALRPSSSKGFAPDGMPLFERWDEAEAPVVRDPAAFMLEVVGQQYQPVFRDGDRLVVSPAAALRKGDRVAYKLMKHPIRLGQVQHLSAKQVSMVSVSNKKEVMAFGKTQLQWCHKIMWCSQ